MYIRIRNKKINKRINLGGKYFVHLFPAEFLIKLELM